MNPSTDRQVFSCPPRPYFVLAALRLAKLIEAIRTLQADVPITLVCHSQGNMVGMAAAFLGDRMENVTDGRGRKGRCVADNYVLCNPPYSLVESNAAESICTGHMKDRNGRTGRQSVAARIDTLKAFFGIVGQPAESQQGVAEIDNAVENKNHRFSAQSDRALYGYGAPPLTCQRVTLYCNPHDEVISSSAIQGIGWRGMSQDEINRTGGNGIFCQRVFAQGFPVGGKEMGSYRYWADHYRRPAVGSQEYWVPESLPVRYSIAKGVEAHRGQFLGSIITLAMAPLGLVAARASDARINALPPRDWQIPLTAPRLGAPDFAGFKPQAMRFGQASDEFDQDFDAPGQSRNAQGVRADSEPYAGDRAISTSVDGRPREASDAARGDVHTEAALRYEDHARLRMQARREGLAGKTAETTQEDDLEHAGADYKAWRDRKIKTYLAENIDLHATDHSTILSNPMHSEKALAYDVAVGLCYISAQQMHELRKAADWRFLNGLDQDNSSRPFHEYFKWGRFKGLPINKWVASYTDGRMPDKIADEREHVPQKMPRRASGH